MSNKLAKMSSLQRENLLINSDFRYGVINQKGLRNYEMSGYLIDLWRSINANGKLVINSGSITLTTSNQYSAQFMQPVYYNMLNERVTIAVEVKNIVGTVYLNLLGTNKALQKGLNVYTYNITQNIAVGNGFQYFYFSMGSGSSVEIEFIKLEQGNIFTGMPVWNYTLELMKCYRYFQIYEGSFIQSLTSGTYFFGQQLRIMMSKDPSVKVRRLNSGNGSDISSKVKSIVCYKNLFDYIVLSSSHNEIQIRGSFELDAYDY